MIDFPLLKRSGKENLVFFLILISAISFVSCGKSNKELKKDADKYYTQAIDYYERGYLSNAKNLFEEVLDIDNELKTSERIGDIHLYLGLIAFENADYEAALNHYQKADELFKSKFDRSSQSIAKNNIGNIYSALGDYKKALIFYKSSLGISQLSADKEGEAIAKLNIGTVFAEEENYQNAFNYFTEAFNSYEILGDIDGEVNSSIKIGDAYLKFGAYYDALNTFDFALDKAKNSGMNKKIPAIMNFIGLVYFNLKDYQKAISSFNYGLNQITNPDDDPEKAWILNNNLADSYSKLFQTEKAIQHYNQAVKISDKFGEGLNSGLIKLKIAFVEITQNPNPESKELHDAENILNGLYDFFNDIDYPYGKINCLAGMAKAADYKNKAAAAFEYLSEMEGLLNNYSFSGNNRLAEDFCIQPDLLNKLSFYEVFSTLNKSREMLEYSLKNSYYKKITFLKSLNYFDVGNKAENKIIDSLNAYERQINFLKYEIANEKGKRNSYRNEEKLEHLKSRLEEKLKEENQPPQKLLNKYYNLIPNVTVQDIQNKLDENSAFIGFFNNDQFIYLTLTGKNKFISKKIAYPEEILNGQVSTLIKNLSGENDSTLSPLLIGIYNKLISPIENEIKNYSKIIFYVNGMYDSNLPKLPFHALINGKGENFYETKEVEYFGGFNSSNYNSKKIAIISDDNSLLNKIKKSDNNIIPIPASQKAKTAYLNLNSPDVIFDSPVFFSLTQPNASYFEMFSDSSSSPEFNLRFGETSFLQGEKAILLSVYSDNNNYPQYISTLLPGYKNVFINQYSSEEKIDSKNILTFNELLLKNNLNYTNMKKAGIKWQSFFEYVKL